MLNLAEDSSTRPILRPRPERGPKRLSGSERGGARRAVSNATQRTLPRSELPGSRLDLFGEFFRVVEIRLLEGFLRLRQQASGVFIDGAPSLIETFRIDRLEGLARVLDEPLNLFRRFGRVCRTWLAQLRCSRNRRRSRSRLGRGGHVLFRVGFRRLARLLPRWPHVGRLRGWQLRDWCGIGFRLNRRLYHLRWRRRHLEWRSVGRRFRGRGSTRSTRCAHQHQQPESDVLHPCSTRPYACGNVSLKRVPRPGVDCTSTSPSCNCTIR